MTELLCAYCLASNQNAGAPLTEVETGRALLEMGAAAVATAHQQGLKLRDYNWYLPLPVVAVSMVDGTAVCVQHVEHAMRHRQAR